MSHYPCPNCAAPVPFSSGECRQCGHREPDDATRVAPHPARLESYQGSVILEVADGRRFAVRDGEVVGRTEVGRECLETFVEVSRRHAQFVYREGQWFIVDLSSSNGTYLDGQKLSPRQPTPFVSGQRLGFSRALPLTASITQPPPTEMSDKAEPVDPNRRTLVILFADVKGSVDFYQERGTIIGKNWIFKLFGMLTESIETHGGTHLKNIGDALLAVFDDPHAAARAAVTMQHLVREHNRVADSSDHYFLRIGMNKGSVLFENNDVFGNAVNIASRVQDLAPPERIYITGNLRQKLGDTSQLQIRLVGHKELKGVKATTEIYEILSGAELDPHPSTSSPD